LTYALHRGAEDDLAEAARFYRREGSRALAARFLDEFERIAKLLVEHPGIGTHRPRTNAAGFRFQAFPTPSSIGKLRSEFAFWSCATRTVIPSMDSSAGENRLSPYARCKV
jgi:plasmid stabilization system protein ParE